MEMWTGWRGPIVAKVPRGPGDPDTTPGISGAVGLLHSWCSTVSLWEGCSVLRALLFLVQRQSTLGDTNRQEATQTSGFVNN